MSYLHSPPMVPALRDTVYLVVDDFARIGRCFRETDLEHTDLESVLTDFLTGQFNDPLAVIALNTDEGWSRDVSEDIAQELQFRAQLDDLELSASAQAFVERHVNKAPVLPLRQPRLRVIR